MKGYTFRITPFLGCEKAIRGSVMIQYVQSFLSAGIDIATNMSQTEWALASVAVIAVGFFALRGFTERI